MKSPSQLQIRLKTFRSDFSTSESRSSFPYDRPLQFVPLCFVDEKQDFFLDCKTLIPMVSTLPRYEQELQVPC